MKIPPEQINVECKTADGGRLPHDLWQTIGAFSNSEGGKIYFGVRPDGSKVNLSELELDKIQRDILSLTTDAFNVRIVPSIIIKQGVLIAVFEPIQAQSRPVYRKRNGLANGTYIRVGSSNVKADAEIIQRFVIAARGGAETIYFEEEYAHILNEKKIDEYITLLNERNDRVYQKFSKNEILVKQKVITKDKRWTTLFGLLAFAEGKNLQDIVAPTINVRVTQYAGYDKVDVNDPNETYIDNQEFNGPVLEQFNKAFTYIKARVPTHGIVSNGKRNDVMSIPEIAIREALANAIVHRDYSTTAACIQVDIYFDRIEISNPGNSLVPISELDTAPSTSRNPLLMNFLKEYGITDQKARGIRTIVSVAKDNELTTPVFKNLEKSFTVILFNTSIFTEEDERFISQLEDKINQRQKKAIVYARKHNEGINNSIYRDVNNMQMVRDDKKANKELTDLVNKGIFDFVGDGRWRRYVLKK